MTTSVKSFLYYFEFSIQRFDSKNGFQLDLALCASVLSPGAEKKQSLQFWIV